MSIKDILLTLAAYLMAAAVAMFFVKTVELIWRCAKEIP